MATPYKKVINAFLFRIEEDYKFFHYRNSDDRETERLIRKRAHTFLMEACGRLMLEGMPTVDFSVDYCVDGSFSFDLTYGEIYLLSSLMYEAYMARDIAKLKTADVNFTGTEMRVFDPSNARKTFMEMYTSVKAENDRLLDVYRNTGRLDGKYITIDFEAYDDSEDNA